MKNFLTVVLISISFYSANCQNSKIIAVQPFTQLAVFGSFDVDLDPSAEESMKLESDDVDLSKITIEQEGETLKIKATKNLFSAKAKVKISLKYKQLTLIKADGGAQITSIHAIEKQNLKLIAQNGANFTFPIKAENVMAVAGQGSTISLEGNCGNLEVKANNGGLFNAYELKSANVLAKARTGSIIKINPLKKLDAHVFINGQISYRGTPQLTVNQIFGGSVEKVTE